MRSLLKICFPAFLCFFPAAAQARSGSPDGNSGAKRPFFSVSCDENRACLAAPRLKESAARSFAVPKPAGIKRVFVVGGAAAHLGTPGEPGAGIPGFEIINCGVEGYGASRTEEVFLEILKYEPDLVVVIGGDSGGKVYPVSGFYSGIKRPFARILEKYYGRKYGSRLAGIKMALRAQERRLDSMASAARKAKAPLVFCTLPSNLRDLPPSGFPLVENEAFFEGMNAFEKGEWGKAAARFQKELGKDRDSLFPRFYLAKSLEALKRFKEARENYSRVLELDIWQERVSPAGNEMIRTAAARRGAGLCDLERAFFSVSDNGLPGFRQIYDGVHWRPSYNGLVWNEIAGAARAAGLAGFKDIPARAPSGALTENELKLNFSEAVAYLDNSPEAENGALCERTIAEFNFIEAERPGLLKRASLTEKTFSGFFPADARPRYSAERLGVLKPLFLAHLAEMERRRKNFREAVALAERALAAKPDSPHLRLLKALCLFGSGRKAEGEKELLPLYNEQAVSARARAAAKTYSVRAPVESVPRSGGAVQLKDTAASKKLSDDAVKKMASGDLPAAERLLTGALNLNPANAEALLNLCSLELSKKEFQKALDACGAVPAAAASYYPAAQKRLLADSFYTRSRVLLKLGNPREAGKYLKLAIGAAPDGWENLGRALAEAEKPDGI